MTAPSSRRVFGLILAGGLGRRMGGVDKALIPLAGRPLLAHVVAALAPQVDRLLLSANGPPERFAAFGLTVLPDADPSRPGPLAGILAGLDYLAMQAPDAEMLVSAPADAPVLPHDLVSRLSGRQRASGAPAVCAASGGRTHPVACVWTQGLRPALRAYLEAGDRRVWRFLEENAAVTETWDTVSYDPFTNVNTPEDVQEAEHILTASR